MSISPQFEPALTDPSATQRLAVLRSTDRVRSAAPRPWNTTGYIRLARVGDTAVGLVALVGGFLAANLGRVPAGMEEFLGTRLTIRNLLLLVSFMVIWRLLCSRAGLYDPARIRRLSSEVLRVALVCGIGTAAAMVFPLISRTGAFSPLAVLYFGAVAGAGLLVLRGVLRTVTATGAPAIHEVLIVGSGPRAWNAYRDLESDPRVTCRLLGFVDIDDRLASEEIRRHWAGPLSELESILMRRE
ncbi:MAG: hypothetical protein ACREM9_00685, partial [Gemmatimonadales bacterium]